MSFYHYKKQYINPSYACAICGQSLIGKTLDNSHRCPPRVLRAIDAAHAKDTDEVNTKEPSLYERLRDGFELRDCNESD